MADMHTHIRQFIITAVAVACTTEGVRAQHPAMPPGMTHEEHLAQMQKDTELKKRGGDARV